MQYRILRSVLGVGGFVKSYVMGRGSSSKSLLFLTRVGGWSEKGQKHPYVISEQSLRSEKTNNSYFKNSAP